MPGLRYLSRFRNFLKETDYFIWRRIKGDLNAVLRVFWNGQQHWNRVKISEAYAKRKTELKIKSKLIYFYWIQYKKYWVLMRCAIARFWAKYISQRKCQIRMTKKGSRPIDTAACSGTRRINDFLMKTFHRFDEGTLWR